MCLTCSHAKIHKHQVALAQRLKQQIRDASLHPLRLALHSGPPYTLDEYPEKHEPTTYRLWVSRL